MFLCSLRLLRDSCYSVNMTSSRHDTVNLCIRISCCVGFLLSCYSYYVETSLEHDKSYSPMCDISEHMSCSVAFLSEYGKGFGITGKLFGDDSILNQPNGIFGCAFYLVFLLLSYVNEHAVIALLIGLAGLSNLASCYLAFVLYFILHDACLVCIAMYVVNVALVVLAALKMQCYKQIKQKSV